MSEEERRDHELGAVLRELEVPPPRPDFYPRLMARLEEEAAAAARRERQRFWARTVPRIGAVASVAAIVLALTWVGLPGSDDNPGLPGSPRPAGAITADELRRRVEGALARSSTLEGDLSVETTQGGVSTSEDFRFVITAEGDFRVTAADGRSDHSYSTRQGLQRSFRTVAESGAVLASESRGLATGPPDPAPDASVLARQLGALVRAFVGSRADVAVTETTYEGRAAWNLVVPVDSAALTEAEFGAVELDITVDQQTGFPLRSIERRRQPDSTLVTIREVGLSNLVADQPVSPDRFLLPFPVTAGLVTSLDQGFRRVGLSEAAATVGYQPVVPARAPDGFKLAEVAVARMAGSTAAGRNPPSRDVVSVAYQRGFDRFVISTRAVGADPARWVDPLTVRMGEVTVERFTPSAGRFRGAQGELVSPNRAAPHVWLLGERLVVTVSGDLTREDLLTVVDSL